MERTDVIAALATAPGRAAIGVIRLSGPDLRRWFPALLGRDSVAPRHATLTRFLDAAGAPIDVGLALYFPAPRSYSGENMLELHAHGGPEVLKLVLGRCLELGARPAEPGEFTRRAFLNDRLDLLQAEAVADLIEASSSAAARSAIRSLSGEFSQRIHVLVDMLIELRTLVEACIDFPEEGLDLLTERGGRERLNALRAELELVGRAARSGSLLREGAHVVLFGRPNVGKSSLLNRFAGEEVAIVTDVPGTTRDALRELIHLEGVPIHIVDTAGLRSTADKVETIGISRTWRALRNADLGLLVIDATAGESDEDRRFLEQLAPEIPRIVVFNKIDLTADAPGVRRAESRTEVRVSAQTGEGLDLLQEEILRRIGWQPQEEGVFLARTRHLHCLRQAAEHLAEATAQSGQLELFAEELRLAQAALNQITGAFTSEDLLGEIFSRFCIGK
jgi:tRNA modification GTPase